MGKLSFCLHLLSLAGLLLSGRDAAESDTRSGRCKNPNGKVGQLKNFGCKSAVCTKEGGKTSWKECELKATAENQRKMIEIQTKTHEKVDQINNKQTRVIERQDKMIENQHQMSFLQRRACGVGCNLPIVFQKAEEFTLRKNNLLGVLPFLGKQFVISFQLLITAATVEEFENIIHFTIGSAYLGKRTPALWLTKGTRLYVGSAINREPQYNMESYLSLSLNTWHNIEISQLMLGSEVFFDLKVDGTGYAGVTNFAPTEFSAVEMFAGSPWYMLAKGRIRNLEVMTETVDLKNSIPVVFELRNEFKLGENSIIGGLPFIAKQFIISFQIKLNSGVPDWTNVLHFTNNAGDDNVVYGSSTPSIGIWSKNALGVFSAINGNPHYWTYKDVPRLTYGVWYNIEISQLWIDNKFVFEAKFEKAGAGRDGWINFGNGTSTWSVVNNDARMFENINIMGSLGDPADAYVRNIVVKTKPGN